MMFILSFFSSFLTYLIHAVFIAGVVGIVVGTFASKFPFISSYGNIIKSIAGLLLVAGLFGEGYSYGISDYLAKVKEFEEKVKVAEQQSKEVNTVIEKKYIDRVKTVKDTQYIIQEKIKEVEKKIDAECKVAPEAIQLLNQASITPKKEAK